MKKLLSKAKSTFQDYQSNTQTQPSTIAPPTPLDLLRYRYHHGTNLGSIFVLERWLHPSMFPASSPGGSELDAVSTSIEEIGIEKTREKWEAHWRNALTEQDLAWLVREARCTSIRLPVGYFTLGPEFCKGTPFEEVSAVYVRAWEAVMDVVRRAREWGVGVLLDLHAVPGGANGEEHSGTSSSRAELWGDRRNLELGRRCLVFMVGEMRGVGLVGIQVCNEAGWEARGMEAWYENVIVGIGEVDGSVPVYISDGWNLGKSLEWCNNRKGRGNAVVVDTHRYFTFSEEDRNQSPQQIIGRIGGELGELNGKEGSVADKGEAQLVVGEWSCVLDGRTWEKVRPEEKDGLVREFGQVQCRKWEERSGGSYFWTMKMDWMDGGEWGFVEQTKKGNVTAPAFMRLSAQNIRDKAQSASERREEMRNTARKSHEEYWNRTCPGQRFEHHLYSEGWDIGFSDAQRFFVMRSEGALGEKATVGADRIGCLEIWTKERLAESGQRGQFVWEWEQGFRIGVKAFQQCVGI